VKEVDAMAKEETTLQKHNRLRCPTCKIITNHRLAFSHSAVFIQEDPEWDDSESGPDFWEENEYKVWICNGCDTAGLEIYSKYFDRQEADGEYPYEQSTHLPDRQSTIRTPKRFTKLDRKMQKVYNEVIVAYNNRLNLLCAIGLRSLIEGICNEKNITVRGLEKKLEELRRRNHLPSNLIDYLCGFKFIGDEAVHEFRAPSDNELRFAIEAVEDLLNFLYHIEYELMQKTRMLYLFRSDDINAFFERRKKKKQKNDKKEQAVDDGNSSDE
jgi:hypothetical protein